MEITKIDVNKNERKGFTTFIYPVDKNRKINAAVLM